MGETMTPRKYHIQMFSVHGLLRAENMQLGHDADTGGRAGLFQLLEQLK